MSGRTVLRDALTAGLPGWQVVSDPRALDSVRKPGAVVLGTTRITRIPGSPLLGAELALWVLTATTKTDQIEDDLDSLLKAVCDVLEPLDAFSWTAAERLVLADTYDGYKVTVTCGYQIETEGT